MTKKTKTAGKTAKRAIQNYSYANVYAIQTCPLANDEDRVEVTKFITEDSPISETVWPCSAEWFDTPVEALGKLLALKLPREKGDDGLTYPRVVRVELKCDIKSANDELYDSLLK
jgi:hypothetical protein